jgi:hypothetical protein
MRKWFARLTVAALVAGSLVTGLAGSASAHDSSIAKSCTGEEEVASYLTAAGNYYALRNNTCAALYAIGSDYYTVEGITRYTCYRNGLSWDGCRVDGYVQVQWRTEGTSQWYVHSSVYFHVPDTGYVSNTGRLSSGHLTDNEYMVVRGKGQGNNVRFLLADGTTVLVPVADNWSGEYIGFN